MGCSGEVGVKREQDKNISDLMLKSAAEKKESAGPEAKTLS